MAELKNIEKCPVCSMTVKTDDIKYEYKGHTYYFCSESDKTMFIADAEKYVGRAKAA